MSLCFAHQIDPRSNTSATSSITFIAIKIMRQMPLFNRLWQAAENAQCESLFCAHRAFAILTRTCYNANDNAR